MKGFSSMKTATLVKDGPNQVVRLPEEFRFEGENVYIHKAGNLVVLLPENEA
jgi:antitoxin VapB